MLQSSTPRKTATLTFGECAENHYSMEKIGTRDEFGFSPEELRYFAEQFPDSSELIDLRFLMSHSNVELPESLFLVIRDPYPRQREYLEEALLKDQLTFDANGYLNGIEWDKKKFQYKKVVNSHARHNVCFDKLGEHLLRPPNYEEGKGTVYNIDALLPLMDLHHKICDLTGSRLKVEGNLYYDLDKCYIGFHGDKERRKVVGYRVGAPFPLHFRWHITSQVISEIYTVHLNSGDMYFMSDFTTGSRTQKGTKISIKHAAGTCSTIFK